MSVTRMDIKLRTEALFGMKVVVDVEESLTANHAAIISTPEGYARCLICGKETTTGGIESLVQELCN